MAKSGMPRRMGPADLPAVLAAVLDRIVPPELQRLTRIRELWADILPRRLTDCAWPMLVQGHRLIVHVQDSQWLHEMTYWRQDILDQMEAAWPQWGISQLDCFVGEFPPVSVRHPQVHIEPRVIRTPPLSPDVPRETMDALNQIREPRLREALAVARSSLGRPRR